LKELTFETLPSAILGIKAKTNRDKNVQRKDSDAGTFPAGNVSGIINKRFDVVDERFDPIQLLLEVDHV
jgi:hypothetical protein